MPYVSNGCVLPTASEWHQLQMELFPQYLEGRVGLQILPFRTTDLAMITLQQPDIFKGKQDHRGLGKPTRQVPERYNPYGTLTEIHPGYWGEHDQIGEEVMTKWGGLGQCASGSAMDMSTYLMWMQQRLLQRRAVLIEYNIWQTLVFGRYTALAANGAPIHEGRFNIQSINASGPWTNFSGSFPLRDFRQIQLLGRGTSADFGTCAKAYMNRETANLLFANTNPNDVGRIGLSACCNFMSLGMINEQFAAQGLPQIVIYDGGWIDDSGVFNLFIPFGYVVVIGCRPGNEPVGAYWLTRNAVGCQIESGFWQDVVDTCAWEKPRRIIVYDGHNGGPAIHYPRAIVVMRVI